MPSDTQQEGWTAIRIERDAQAKLREVVAAIKERMGTSATLSEALILACNHYLTSKTV